MKTKLSALVLLLVLVVSAAWISFAWRPKFLDARGTESPAPASQETAATASLEQTANQLPTGNPAVWQEAITQLSSGEILLPDSGAERAFELATDEVYTPTSRRSGAVVSIPGGSGGPAFLDRIRSADLEIASTQPILYEAGLPRTEAFRRVVTNKVLIEASTREEAEELGARTGLTFKEAPSFAPGKFIFEAESPWDVLPLIAQPRGTGTVGLQPMLAAHRAKKSNPNDHLFFNEWHLKFQNQGRVDPSASANVSSVWGYGGGSAIRGQGIVVGIVDDGVDTHHPDLAPNMNVTLGYDWIDNDFDPRPEAGDSHGTAVAGNVAARGNNEIGVIGAAPEATLVGLRLVGGLMTDDDEAAAMIHENDKIHLKNNSWGPVDIGIGVAGPGPLTLAALANATTSGRQGRGTISVWAGGNGLQAEDSSNFDGYANSIHVIAVGASDSRARQAPYSESGANLAVCAPSNGDAFVPGITTTDLRGSKGYNFGGLSDYRNFLDYTNQFGGTSSATPTVAGIVALMLQANPALGPRDVKEILMTTAAKIHPQDLDWVTNAGGFDFNHKFGAGRVDGAAAVAAAATWKNLPPVVTFSSTNSNPVPVPDYDPFGATHTHTINAAPDIRVEHVTLGVRIPDNPKGHLSIVLTSPSGTPSVFCEPHRDTITNFDGWTFMTVRCWGEPANGNWTVKVADVVLGNTAGNLDETILTIHGSNMTAHNPPPFVEIVSPKPGATIRTPVSISANATDLQADGTPGTITEVRFYVESADIARTLVHTDSVPPYSFSWNASDFPPDVYTVDAEANDSQGLAAASVPVSFSLLENSRVAAWDFETHDQGIPLEEALFSIRQYAANFRTGNATLYMDGSHDSSEWDANSGEIWSGTGTTLNAEDAFSKEVNTTSGLMLRAGKNRSANGKSLVFQFDMSNAQRLNVSYAAYASPGGFDTHIWEWSKDGAVWEPLQTITLVPGDIYTRVRLAETAKLNNTANAYLRVTFQGATADLEHNLLDNILFSATR